MTLQFNNSIVFENIASNLFCYDAIVSRKADFRKYLLLNWMIYLKIQFQF